MYKTLPEDHMYDREEVNEIVDWFVSRYDSLDVGNIDKFPLVIVEKATGKIMGDIGIGKYSKDESKTELFYCSNSADWNRGYISEAVGAFLSYIKENRLAVSLIGDVVVGNLASSKILLKNGFREIGVDDKKHSILYELDLSR